MPASLLELKRKIASVKQTGKITEAMRMVSASKLNQTENRDKDYTVYNDHVRKTISHLISSQVVDSLRERDISIDKNNISKIDYTDVFGLGITADMIQPRKNIKTTGFLVVTGDRGLVGSYNSSVIKNMMSIFDDERAQGREVKVLAVGSVGAQFFKKNNVNVVYEKDGVSDVPTFDEVLPIVSTAIKMFLNGVYDQLYVCYTHHVNSLSSAFRVEKMLPIVDLDIGVKEAEAHKELEYDIDSVLMKLLPQYARSTIYGAILDAKTAEHASSMTAMQSATDNANDLVSNLTTKLNRARQAQITTEITEIISGANALE